MERVRYEELVEITYPDVPLWWDWFWFYYYGAFAFGTHQEQAGVDSLFGTAVA